MVIDFRLNLQLYHVLLRLGKGGKLSTFPITGPDKGAKGCDERAAPGS